MNRSMKPSHLTLVTPRFARSMDEAFRTPEYAQAIHAPARRSGLGKWIAVAGLAALAFYLIVKV